MSPQTALASDIFRFYVGMAAAVLVVATMAMPVEAFAQNRRGQGQTGSGPGASGPGSSRPPSNGHRRTGVPEFDPAAVGAIAALVASGGVLLARRRSRRS